MNIPYHAARTLASWNRTQFKQRIGKHARQTLLATGEADLDIYCFAGEKQFPEVVRCAGSFWKNIGRPRNWIIVSDGSLSFDTARQMIDQDERCKLISWQEFLSAATPKCFQTYAKHHPLGKKLILLWHISRQRNCIYTDADVLFYADAAKSIQHLPQETECRFIEDYAAAFDARLLKEGDDLSFPVNSGFLLFGKSFTWDLAAERLERTLQETKDFWSSNRLHFTEQTVTHIALTQAGAKPFPKDKFVVSVEDQFKWGQMTGSFCVRHYVGPVRHKMWQPAWAK